MIDHYIYILNVRFSGDIHYEKEISEDLLDCAVPSMILQPIVENCVNHGIREMSGEGRIWLKVYHGEEDTLVISIRDNGIGIHPEDLYHIFKRFYRSRFSQDTQGLGLGLPLAKAIVEANGGTIEVESDFGKGTVFTMSFPIPTKL